MEKTGKKIHDFVKKKLEEAKGKLAKIGDGYKHSDRLDTECCMLEAKIKAYKEVLSFISADPKIIGTTTVDKSFERLLLDNCPEVKKKLKAFEVIRDFVKDMMRYVDIIPPSQGGGTKVLVSSEDFEYIYECKNQEEADLFGEAIK